MPAQPPEDARTQGLRQSELPAFDLRVERRPDAATVAARGDLDRAAAPELWAAFEKIAEEMPGAPVTVDLRQVAFMDSGGLRVLLDGRHLFREGFVILAAGRSRDLLEATGCERFLEIRY